MKKSVILFPGQGPQYPGMGKMFYDSSDEVRVIYRQASEWLEYDLAQHSFEGTLDGLSDTRYTQPAILVAGYSAYRYYIANLGLAGLPWFLAGHSMGEITALLCSGALSFKDALRLTVKRGELMNRVSQTKGGTMAAVKELYWKDTERICRQISTAEEHVSVAAYNSDRQTVITGHAKAVEEAGKSCAESGGIFMPLNITVGSHCPFMQDILEEYGDFVSRLKINRPEIPVYCCLTGQLYSSASEIEKNITDQLVNPVLWNKILKDLKRRDAGIFLEAGPGTAVGKFIEGNEGIVISLERSSIDKVREEMGRQVKFIPTPITKCLALMVSIPDMNDRPGEYNNNFHKLYRHLQSLQDTMEKEERLPAMDEIQAAVRLLEPACFSKRIPSTLMQVLKDELIRQFPYTLDLLPAESDAHKFVI